VPLTGTVYVCNVPVAPVPVDVNVIWSLQPPAMQTLPPVQTVPHVPQFEGSVVVSTHVPPHPVFPGAQHKPLLHVAPAVQTVPHAPQLLESELRSRHAPPQFVVPPPHVRPHTPPEHSSPVAQA
jgi:hypothetical protein